MTDSAPSEDPQPPGRFDVLRQHDYRWLWLGGIFVFLASQAQQIARGWLAFELTGNNRGLGGVIFGFGVSSLLASPFSGVLADRVSKRAILLVAQSALAVSGLGIAIAITTDTIEYWMLIAASVVQGGGISLLGPARLAMTADLVERSALTNAIFLSNGSIQATRVLGPALAGVMIAIEPIGTAGVYFFGATLSFLSVIVMIPLPASRATHVSGRSPVGDLVDGVRYVRGNRRISRLLVIGVLVVMFGFPHIALLPGMVEDIFGLEAWAFGLLNASAAIGAVTVSITLANVDPKRLGSLQIRAGFIFAGALIVFALMPTFALAALVMVVVGGSSAAYQAMNNSQVLTLADVEYHGRVQSLLMLAFSGFGLIALPTGLLADAIGIRETMIGMGVVVGIVIGVGLLWRRSITPPPLTDL